MFQHEEYHFPPKVGDESVKKNEAETITFTSINVRVMTGVFQE